jgi:COP9 signalosome complex subunit 4
LFNKAVVCGILAPSGARKARTMTVLMKDERCKMNPFYDLVSKMTLGMVIREKDSKEFEGQLDTHQKVTLADGNTVLGKALIEHNIQVLSKIYMNIKFVELGNFLRIAPRQAEQTIAKMIAEQRIGGVLD